MCAMNEESVGQRSESGGHVRKLARDGYTGLTVGRARGYQQANLIVVPSGNADELIEFCRANPLASPLLGHTGPGDPHLPMLGADIDVRIDVPRYELHRGDRVEVVTSITGQWRSDSVALAVGCWFGAERALAEAGIRMRHVELGIQGPLFRTNVPTVPRGRFHPNLVVSMRPFQTADVDAVAAITATMPRSHGAPIHRGDPGMLGITDVESPDWGEVLVPADDELALFWPCGLTVTEALISAGVPEFITHAPGSMLVTDLPDRDESR
jgi:uncharacterized protein YcsI (UPF0317 family)